MYSNKPFQTIEQQILLLRSRGLEINDDDFAYDKLLTIGYHYLSQYFKSFQSAVDIFDSGVTFESIIDLYEFDKQLKKIYFPIFNEIELSIKNIFAYYLGTISGSNIEYANKNIYEDSVGFGKYGRNYITDQNNNRIGLKSLQIEDNRVIISNEIVNYISKNKKNPIIESFYCKYDDIYIMQRKLFEIMELGMFKRVYSAIHQSYKTTFIVDFLNSGYINLSIREFEYLIEVLRISRNQIAHCGRFWNFASAYQIPHSFMSKIKLHSTDSNLPFNIHGNHVMGYLICILLLYHKVSNRNVDFLGEVDDLLSKYSHLSVLNQYREYHKLVTYIYNLSSF